MVVQPPVAPVESPQLCVETMRSGKRKGQPCRRRAAFSQRCHYHTPERLSEMRASAETTATTMRERRRHRGAGGLVGIQFGSLRYHDGGLMFDNGRIRRQLLNGLTYPPEPLTSEEWEHIVTKNPDLPLADRRDHAEAARRALIERHGSEMQLCACGCGERVRWPGRRYLAGHAGRGVDHKRGGAWRNCQECGDMFYALPQQVRRGQGQHCSRRCKNALSRQRNIRTDFQRRLLAAQAASELAPSTFWESQGIRHSTIGKYLELPDRHPTRRTAHQLAPIFGMSVAEIEEMCGGFANEGARNHIPPNPWKGKKLSKQVKEKMSRKLKGRKLSAAQREGISRRQRSEMQDPAKKDAFVARMLGLKPLEPRIKYLVTRRGADYVRANLDDYTEGYAAEFSLGKATVRGVILRAIGDPVAPRTGKTLKGSKADIIRELAASGMTRARIIQEGVRRGGGAMGQDGWNYDYVDTVFSRMRAAAS